MDRIDIKVEVTRPPVESLRPDCPPGESSAAVAERIAAARRYQDLRSGRLNASLDTAELTKVFSAGEGCYKLLEDAASRLNLSARAYQRIQRVARTIADLGAHERVSREHIAEAIALWQVNRNARQLPTSSTM